MSEHWKEINGFEGFYEVSDYGRIRSLDHIGTNGRKYKGRILVQRTTKKGYRRVHLSKHGYATWVSVHRVVAEAFCKKPDGMDIVNHIDNDPSNNMASNLEWTDYKGNMQHATKQGRMGWQPSNLAKAQEARKIPVIAISADGKRQMFESGAEAARILGVSRGHIAACCRQEFGYKTVGGYKFEYADPELQARQEPNRQARSKDDQIEELRRRMLGNKIMVGRHHTDETKQKLAELNGRPVQQLDKATDEVIAEFVSANAAKKKTGINHIDACARGTRKTAGGYKWRYV